MTAVKGRKIHDRISPVNPFLSGVSIRPVSAQESFCWPAECSNQLSYDRRKGPRKSMSTPLLSNPSLLRRRRGGVKRMVARHGRNFSPLRPRFCKIRLASGLPSGIRSGA